LATKEVPALTLGIPVIALPNVLLRCETLRAIGPTSAISLMVAGKVGEMAGGDMQRYAQIASLAAFTVAPVRD
jgi:hypothetical protein